MSRWGRCDACVSEFSCLLWWMLGPVLHGQHAGCMTLLRWHVKDSCITGHISKCAASTATLQRLSFELGV